MKEETIIEIIRMEAETTRDFIKAEVDRIDEMDKKRNGKIEKLEKETIWVRWINRNPKKAIIIFLILMIGSVAVVNAINVHRTAERILNVELKDK